MLENYVGSSNLIVVANNIGKEISITRFLID